MNFDCNHLLWTSSCPPFSLGCTFLCIFPFYFNVFFLDSDSAWERKHSICLPESYFPSLLPIFLQTHDFILFYRWIILCHVYKSQFLCLLIHWWHLGRVCILTVANSASINTDLQGSLVHADFLFSICLWSGTAGWEIRRLTFVTDRGQAHVTTCLICIALSYVGHETLAFQLQQCLNCLLK